MALTANSTYGYVDLNYTQLFVETANLTDRGMWSSLADYSAMDAVLYLGALYVCIAPNTGTSPNGDLTDEWSVLVLVREGEQGSSTTYSGTVSVNFSGASHTTVLLAGDVYFTIVNQVADSRVDIRLVADGTNRLLYFTDGPRFVGARPGTLAADRLAVVSFDSFGSIASDIVVSYAAEE